jgi:hypothetical protein
LELDLKLWHRGEWSGLSATGLTVMANTDVDGGAAPDLPAGERRISERPAGCGVGPAGAVDPVGRARRATAQDRHPGGDERVFVFAADRLPWRYRYLPRDSFPPRSTVYNICRKFQLDGVREAIWAELHMALQLAFRPLAQGVGCGPRYTTTTVGKSDCERTFA